MVNIVSAQNSILSKFIAEIRDVNIQKDSMRFRRNLERIAEILSYEISKTLEYKEALVETPLGQASVAIIVDDVVLATIMRAGIPFHAGFLNYFDSSSCAFVSAYRKTHKDNSFEIKLEYVSCGSIEGKVLILVDPMLATGSSAVVSYNALVAKGGEPRHVHIASAVASEQGVDYVKQNMPMNKTTIWCAAVDEELTSKAYIVPGIGDAGDLAFGVKNK